MFIFFLFSFGFSVFLNYFLNYYKYRNIPTNEDRLKILYQANLDEASFFQKNLENYHTDIDNFNNYLKKIFPKNSTIDEDDFINDLNNVKNNYLENFYSFLISSLFYVTSDIKNIFIDFAMDLTSYYINMLKNFFDVHKKITTVVTVPENMFLDIQNNLSSDILFYNETISDSFNDTYQIVDNINLPIPSEISFYLSSEEPHIFPFSPFIIKRNTVLPVLKTKADISFFYLYHKDHTITNQKISIAIKN